ncbi:substrate-binding domain-containing protein [Dactylosporangium darangshiense]|uniref:substrate-binding domain-containing protein n=1 Tax=Dactylosporangium darangshiense TaxID=579108 RepID=UPI003629AF8E
MVALNDSMAVGALTTLRERDIAVPGGISLIGFDDMPIARDVTPPLTTVRLPLTEMGARAMSLALDTDGDAARIEPAPATLIRRASSQPLTS